MLHRTKKKQDANKGKWIGVGGHFEEKESPEDCMIREVFEETNLKITEYKYRAIITFVSDQYETEYMHLFTASAYEGQIKECSEGELKWIPKDQIFDLNLWEGDKEFLAMLMENKGFFTMKLVYQGDSIKEVITKEY